MVALESDRLAPGASFGVLLWVLVGAACCAAVSVFEPNLLEEGIELHVAQRLAHGERLYRDVLVFTGPVPFELLASMFRAFGDEIWVARAAVVLLHAVATGAAFAIARAARPGALAHAAAGVYATAPLLLFPLFSIYYYTTIAFHLSVVATLAALRGVRCARWAIGAGVLVAMVALCKQTIGVVLAASLAVGLLAAGRGAGRLRGLLAFSLGGAGTAAVTIGLWTASGILGDALHGMITLPASLEETFDSPFPNLWPPGQLTGAAAGSATFYLPYFYLLTQGILVEPSGRAMLATQLLFAVPQLALVATLARLAVGRFPQASVLHSALYVTWLSNLFPRCDWGHLTHALPVAVAQLCLVAPGESARAAVRRATELAAALVMLAIAGGSLWAIGTIHRMADPVPLATRVPLRPVSIPLRGTAVRKVIDFIDIHTQPGDPIFVARAEPLLYFATDRLNPTPYPGVFPAVRAEQQRAILEALERVRFVVMSDVDQPAMTYYRDQLPAVQACLERFFRIPPALQDGDLTWLVLLERGRDRGATAVDLLELAPSGRPFVRDRTGALQPGRVFSERLSTRANRRPLGFYLGEGGGGIDFEIAVPEAAIFQADAGLDKVFAMNEIFQTPPNSEIRVSIGHAGEMTRIAGTVLGPDSSQRWTPLEADLQAWAGQRVTLRIELIHRGPTAPRQLGYVGSPRLARPVGSGDRAIGATTGSGEHGLRGSIGSPNHENEE